MFVRKSFLLLGMVLILVFCIQAVTLVAQTTAEEYALEGVWIAAIPSPIGNIIVRSTYIAQDEAKTQFTAEVEQINALPIFMELYPELEDIKFAGGQVSKTGLNTYEATLIEYFLTDGGPGLEEIVGIAIISGNLTLTGPDTAIGEGTGAYYLAMQDADHDGFPDPGEQPVLCMPWTWSKKRITTIPGCVPTPMP